MSAPLDSSTLLILQTGSPPDEIVSRHGTFAHWIQTRMGSAWSGQFACIDIRQELPSDAWHKVAGIVITGSPSSVTERAPWMLATEAALAAIVAQERVPILGICFGHQILAQALGGHVDRNPNGREIGTVSVTKHERDELFDGLGETFLINATHVDSVVRRPPDTRVLASTALEPTAAFRIRRAWGVQFHPEVDRVGMHAYLDHRRGDLEREGHDIDALKASADACPAGETILSNFAKLSTKR